MMNPRSSMLYVMANVISGSNDYDGDRLNDPEVWGWFMQEVLGQMEACPDEEMRLTLDAVSREQFQEWIDDPEFWMELNEELDRRAEVLMTLMPSEHQGNC